MYHSLIGCEGCRGRIQLGYFTEPFRPYLYLRLFGRKVRL